MKKHPNRPSPRAVKGFSPLKAEVIQPFFNPSAAFFSPAALQKKEAPFFPNSQTNTSGLPENLKTGMENLSGYSMNEVKVHYNSDKPAQLHAHAYAQGADIHLSPGQEKHLPHEAWHVVQQAQGRVRPSAQMKGTQINDDTALEKEADVMGRKAAEGKGSEETIFAQMPQVQPVVQRKMGFEFETGRNTFEENEQGRRLDRKDVAYNHNGVRLEGDSGFHLEFVTEPFDNWPQLGQAILEAQTVAGNLELAARGRPDNKVVVGRQHGFQEDNIHIQIGDPAFEASVQSTEGVALSGIPGLAEEHLAENQEAGDIRAATQKAVNNPRVSPNVFGLIYAIVMYIKRAQRKRDEKKLTTDGPKAYFRLMARTDFNSMFHSLGEAEKQQFAEIVYSGKYQAKKGNLITEATRVNWGDNLFANGYIGEDEKTVFRGPTLGDWLNSIGVQRLQKDALSPPEGYTLHNQPVENENARYGMGLLGMDKDNNSLALFEMRGYRSLFNKTPKANWLTFAKARYDLAAARNNTLHPAPQPLQQVQQDFPQQNIPQMQQQVLAQLPQDIPGDAHEQPQKRSKVGEEVVGNMM